MGCFLAIFLLPVCGTFAQVSADEVGTTTWTETDSRLANHYLRLLQTSPEDGNIVDLLWDLYAKKDQTPLLMDYLKRAAEEGSPAVRLIHAHLLMRAGEIEKARAEYTAVAGSEPDNVHALEALAGIAERQGRVAKALSFYTRLTGLTERATDRGLQARLRLAALLRDSGRTAEAIPLWQEALAARPESAALRNEIVGYLLDAGELEMAREALRELAGSGVPGTRLEALSELERISVLAGDFAGADLASREAMGMLHHTHHRHREFFDRRVRLHERFGRLDELEDELREAVAETNPTERSLYLLARFYEMTAATEKEEEILQRLTVLLPDSIDHRVRLADLQLANDRYGEAAATLDSIIESRATVPLPLLLLRAEIDLKVGAELAARERLLGYIEAKPDDAELREAVLEFARKHYLDPIVEKLLREPTAEPTDRGDLDSAPIALARFLHQRGRVEQVKEVLASFVSGAGDATVERARRLHQAALVYRGLGLLDEALAAVNRALESDPRSIAFLTTRADILIDRGERESAISALETLWEAMEDIPGRVEVDQKIFRLLRAGPRITEASEVAPEPPTGPITSVEQYRRMAAAASRSGGDQNAPNEELMAYFDRIRHEANRDPSLARRYRAGWWAFKLQDNNECYFQLSSAQREAEGTVVEVEELLLELAELNERPTLISRHLQALADADPENRDDYLRRRAEVRFQLGFEDEAIRDLKRLAAKPGASLDTLASLAELYRLQGSPGRQLKVWRTAYGEANLHEKRQILSRLVTALVEQGKSREAIGELMDLIHREADALQRRKQFERQLTLASRHQLLEFLASTYGDVVRRKPFDPFFLEALGRIHLEMGNPGEAYDALKRAHYISGETADLLPELSDLAGQLGERDTGIYFRRQLIARAEGDAVLEHWEALIEMLESDFRSGEAEQLRRRLEIKFGQDPDFLERLAGFYRRNGRLSDAARVLERRVALKPWDVFVLFDLGLNEMSRGRMEHAAQVFERILEQTGSEVAPLPAAPGPWPVVASSSDAPSRLQWWNTWLQIFPSVPLEAKSRIDAYLESAERTEFAYRPADLRGIRLRAWECLGISLRGAPDRDVRAAKWLERAREEVEVWWMAVYSQSRPAMEELLATHGADDNPVLRFCLALGLVRSGAFEALDRWCGEEPFLGPAETLSPMAAVAVAGTGELVRGSSCDELIRFLATLSLPDSVIHHILDQLREADRLDTAFRFAVAVEASGTQLPQETSFTAAQIASWLGEQEAADPWLDRVVQGASLEDAGSVPLLVRLAIAERFRSTAPVERGIGFLHEISERLLASPGATAVTRSQLAALRSLLAGDTDGATRALDLLAGEIVVGLPDETGATLGWEWLLREFSWFAQLSPGNDPFVLVSMGRPSGGTALGEPLSLSVSEWDLRDYEAFEVLRIVSLADGMPPAERLRMIELALPRFRGLDGRLDLARRLEDRGFSREAAEIYYRELLDGSGDYAPLRGLFRASDRAGFPDCALDVLDRLDTRVIEFPPGLTTDYLDEQRARFLFHRRSIDALAEAAGRRSTEDGSPATTSAHLPYRRELIRALRHRGDTERLVQVLEEGRDRLTNGDRVLLAKSLLELGREAEALAWLDGISFDGSEAQVELEAVQTYLRLFSRNPDTARREWLWLGRLALRGGSADLSLAVADRFLERGEIEEAIGLLRRHLGEGSDPENRSRVQLAILDALATWQPEDGETLGREIEIYLATLVEPVRDAIAFAEWGHRHRENLGAAIPALERAESLPLGGGVARLLRANLEGSLEEEWRGWSGESAPEVALLFLSRLGAEGVRLARESVARSGRPGPRFFAGQPEWQLDLFARIGDRDRLAESHAALAALADSFFFTQIRRETTYPTLLHLAALPGQLEALGEVEFAGSLYRRYVAAIGSEKTAFLPFLEDAVDHFIRSGRFAEAERVLLPLVDGSLGFDGRKAVTLYEKWGRMERLPEIQRALNLSEGKRHLFEEWSRAAREGREMIATTTEP